MGNKQGSEKQDKQRLLEFTDNFIDVGESQDARFGKYTLYEEIKASSRTTKAKVISKTVEPTTEEEFAKFNQLMRKREESRSPYLCKLYGVFNSSEELLCGKFHRLTFFYEYCAYDLEMDLNNRTKLPNIHPDKVAWCY
jgi:hypothetical protein